MAEDTIFSKIVRGEIPADIVYRDDLVTAFRDIRPLTPTHVLIVPNETIPTLADVSAADEAVLGRMLRVAADIAENEGIATDGYRVMINCRDHGGQEVYHLHLHLMGGTPLGGMLRR
ncbi:MAG: HIT domain-containing protein [Gemmatimonadota bacterium]|nr:HIT domain-containing protein [Gemmatimonadota bacterium]